MSVLKPNTVSWGDGYGFRDNTHALSVQSPEFKSHCHKMGRVSDLRGCNELRGPTVHCPCKAQDFHKAGEERGNSLRRFEREAHIINKALFILHLMSK